MDGRITFYTYGSSIELNGKLFAAGKLTADFLNLSAERYQPMHQQFVQVNKLAGEYTRTRERAVWWELNEHLEDLSRALREYKLFQLILEEDGALFSETRSYTERYSLLPEEDLDWDDYSADQLAETSRQYPGDEAAEISGFFHTGPEYNLKSNLSADKRMTQTIRISGQRRISSSSGRGTASRSGGTTKA